MDPSPSSTDAIVIRNVSKHFRKSTILQHHTTLKSELIRWVRGQKRPQSQDFIQSLKDVSLRVGRGRTLAVIGRNGAGKSTLLKVITGIYRPTAGNVEVNGRISALLELGAGFHPEFSGRENVLINGIILGMSRGEIRARMQEIIDFSELGDFIDQPVRTYSSGMYMRLAFSVATHVDPDILVIDEILAVGDEHFSHKSRAKMNEFKQKGRTILLVTHDLATVEQWCDEAAWLDQGSIRLVGEPSRVTSEYRQAVALSESTGPHGPVPIPSSPRGLSSATPTEGEGGSGPTTPTDRHPAIVGVQLLNHLDQQALTFDPEDSLKICVEFANEEEVAEAGFSISISRGDGFQLCQIDTWRERICVPTPLPRRGTACLTLERVGLTAGSYVVDVAILSESGSFYDRYQGKCLFSIRSRVQDGGIVRPPHRWSFQGEGSSRSGGPSQIQPKHSSGQISKDS